MNKLRPLALFGAPALVWACTNAPVPADAPTPPVTDDTAAVVEPDAPPVVTDTRECTEHADCDDGDPCNGDEQCAADQTCASGAPVVCGDGETCAVRDGLATCEVLCPIPTAPVLGELADDELLVFTSDGDDEVLTAVLGPDDATEAAVFTAASTVAVAGLRGPVRVLARTDAPGCEDAMFDHTYLVYPAYSGAAGTRGSPAVPMAAPTAWATAVDAVTWGADVATEWQTPERALGPAEGRSDAVCALGEGGAITLVFDPPIADHEGMDLAVFENAFNDDFLELAYVEVSSDGSTFVRFDSAFRGEEAPGPYGLTDPTLLSGLAGKHRQGWGTPFDLAWLRDQPEARAGHLRLDAVRLVRIVDVRGDGGQSDSFGRPIYDPFPTVGSAGFDVDAVGVLPAAP